MTVTKQPTDTQMLDWLIKNPGHVFVENGKYGFAKHEYIETEGVWEETDVNINPAHETERAAIADAMQKAGVVL